MEEALIVLVSQFISPPRRGKGLSMYLGMRLGGAKYPHGSCSGGSAYSEGLPGCFSIGITRHATRLRHRVFDRAIARYMTNIQETLSDARK